MCSVNFYYLLYKVIKSKKVLRTENVLFYIKILLFRKKLYKCSMNNYLLSNKTRPFKEIIFPWERLATN